jgi:hypothetical protein
MMGWPGWDKKDASELWQKLQQEWNNKGENILGQKDDLKFLFLKGCWDYYKTVPPYWPSLVIESREEVLHTNLSLIHQSHTN